MFNRTDSTCDRLESTSSNGCRKHVRIPALLTLVLAASFVASARAQQSQHTFGINYGIISTDFGLPGEEVVYTVFIQNNDNQHGVLISSHTLQVPFGVPGFPDGPVVPVTTCVNGEGQPLSSMPFELGPQDDDPDGGPDVAWCELTSTLPSDGAACGEVWIIQTEVAFEDAGFPQLVDTKQSAGVTVVECICGDGILNTPDEQCDDGNDDDGDGCQNDCTLTCPADLNADGMIDTMDLTLLLGGWGICLNCYACSTDLTGDCQVDAHDLVLLLGAWGICP